MASSPEPFNIFSRRIDVRGVIDLARRIATEVQVIGPEDDWSELTLLERDATGATRRRLRISHDSKFYDSLDWAKYVFEMSNFVAGFAPAPRRGEILRVVDSFRFLLAFPDFDVDIESDDDRVAWIHAICRHLDGVIFMPSQLLDAEGRLLVSRSGRFDPAAVLPVVPRRVDHPNAEDFERPRLEQDGTRPTAGRVARRAIVLAAVSNRGLVENEGDTLEAPLETLEGMLEWIRDTGVEGELEPEEWKVLQRPYGSLESRATVDSVWRLEGLGVLLWALGLYELPPYDELVHPRSLFDLVGLFDAQAARQMIEDAKLRSHEELAAYANHAIMAHWRFREFSLRPVPCDFVKASKGCWIGTFDIARFRISGNDVMVGEHEISQADRNEIGMCNSIAKERHVAINWLLGENDIYSQIETHT